MRHRRTLRAFALPLLVTVILAACQGHLVDPYSIPTPNQGGTESLIGPAHYAPIEGDAAFRTDCRRSHYAFEDPIVSPGRVNSAHLHMFFGNGDMNAMTTDPMAGTSSTCVGGLANRTGYWVPAMIDRNRGNTVVDAYSGSDAIQIYYKAGYNGVEAADIQPYPPGLKIIAGNARGTQLDTQRVWWSCQPTPTITGQPRLDHIPTDCPAGHLVQLSIEFPQCWDGENLDHPDHQSHMAYGLGWPNLGCPADYPVALAQITEHIRWTSTGDTSGWRISSDVTEGAEPGSSAHADWWNGWDPSVFQSIVTNCFAPDLNCQMNLLGDGRMLLPSPTPGLLGVAIDAALAE